MYYRVLQDELQFPEDKAMDQDTKSLIRGVSNFGTATHLVANVQFSFYNAIRLLE